MARLAGAVEMDSVDTRRLAEHHPDPLADGMVFQKPNPFPAMTIAQNVLSDFPSPASRTDADEDGLVQECLQGPPGYEKGFFATA